MTPQSFFDLDSVVAALRWPVDWGRARAACEAVAGSNTPEEACRAWELLAGAIGPHLTAEILSCGDWRSICRPAGPLDDYGHGPDHQVVFVDAENQVVGRAAMDGDQLVSVQFTVEPR